ncbi:MAG: FkbM family methyltransferase [Aggregatilineales bacterium]
MPLDHQLIPIRKQLIQVYAWFRRASGFQRGFRFIGWLYPTELRQKYPIETSIKYEQIFSLRLNTKSHIEWGVFLNGQYERHLISLFKKIVSNNDVVIDVGANIGVHTLIFSRLVGKGGRVIAFEPYPPALKKLKFNLERNHVSNVEILPIAISDHIGEERIINIEGDVNEGMASLLQPDQQSEYSYKVNVNTLDNLMNEHQINQVKLIKMDIQGSEYSALRGAEELLKKFHPLIIFEYDESWKLANIKFDDAVKYLENLGYILHGIDEKDGAIVPIDLSLHTEFIASHKDTKIFSQN